MIHQQGQIRQPIDTVQMLTHPQNPLAWLKRTVLMISDAFPLHLNNPEPPHCDLLRLPSIQKRKLEKKPLKAIQTTPFSNINIAKLHLERVNYKHPTLDDPLLNLLTHINQGQIDELDIELIDSLLIKKHTSLTSEEIFNIEKVNDKLHIAMINDEVVRIRRHSKYDPKNSWLEKNKLIFYQILVEDQVDIDFNTLERLSLSNPLYLIAIMLSPKIKQEAKDHLLNFIINPSKENKQPVIDPIHLTKNIYPFLFAGMENPYIDDLRKAVYFSRGFPQRDGELGKTMILHANRREIPTPENHPELPEKLLPPKEATVCGGRTIWAETGKKNRTYYKFHRKDEPLKDFLREGDTYDFIHQHQHELGFKSDIPTTVGVYRLPSKLAIDSSGHHYPFTDKPIIHRDQNEDFFLVFVYKANKHYSNYAHIQDPDPLLPDPFYRPTEGIKRFYYDIGRSFSIGVTYPSVLPALHGDFRRWCSMPYITLGRNRICGKFDNWDGSSTNNSDISITGLRDWGDHAHLKDISQHTPIFEANPSLPNEIQDRYTASCILADNLIAGVLIWARLKRQDRQYHFKNKESINELKQFFEGACHQFLSGLFGTDSPDTDLRSFLDLGDNYDTWLSRMATEVIYWTYDQKRMFTSQNGNEIKLTWGTASPEINPESEESDCYEGHLIKEGKLPDDLFDYPESGWFTPRLHRFRENFGNNGALVSRHLGVPVDFVSVFPLIQLVNGVTIIATKILASSWDQPEQS